jgi:hypothetical protein
MNFENLKAILKKHKRVKYSIVGVLCGVVCGIIFLNMKVASIGKSEDNIPEKTYIVITETSNTTKSTTSTTTFSTTTSTTTITSTTTENTTTTISKISTTENIITTTSISDIAVIDVETEIVEEVTETLYVPETEYVVEEVSNTTDIDDYSKRLLAEITCHEYGSDWVSTAEKAKIVAGIMNRVNSFSYPDTVYDVLMQDGQFHGSWDGGNGYWPGCIEPNEDSWAAVDYYFLHQSEFGSYTSWYGDGKCNYFY